MIGTTLSHYKIVSQLGKGGMGEVWRAEDTTLGREVAIKVLPDAVASDPERLARFEREAKVLAALDHGNIAAIYGLEEVDGRQLLVMQLIEGEDLQQHITHGALSIENALPIARQIAMALESAHEKGIVHRDLKPANVVVTPDGDVKVLDFGLAKALEGDPSSSGSHPQLTQSPTLTANMTEAGVLLGTAAYMSPEQARGQSADRRADIWAFGVVLMEMLTGKGVYAGDTVSDTLAGVLAREPEWEELPDSTPRRVRDLLERCLDKDARTRLRDIGEARIAIDAYLADPHLEKEEEAEAAGAAVEKPTWKRLLPWAVAAVAIGALTTSFLLQKYRSEPQQPPVRLEAVLSEDPLFIDLGSAVVLSPDGSKVVYIVNQDAGQGMYLRSLDRLQPTQLFDGSESAYHPFFSPDGKWIGYVTPGELKKVPITGGTPITLCSLDRSRGASWGPDGKIVFTQADRSGLMLVSENGGEPEVLTTLDEAAGEITHRWPEMLPDGKAVIFNSATEDMNSADDAIIEAVMLATGERKILHRGGYYPRYTATGHLVFIRDNTLFGLAFDPDKVEPIGAPAPLVEGITSNAGPGGAQFTVSNNGTLAFVSGELGVASYPIVWVDRTGQVTPLWDTPASYGAPKLSPDGKRLSLSILRDNNWDVWIYDLEREVATRLTFDEAYDADQFWSPDGEYLIFNSSREGLQTPFRKRADGSGEAERLTQDKNDFWGYSMTPDGRYIIGETLSQSADLMVLDLEAEDAPQPYLASSFDERYPDFSPDGRWVAYASTESGKAEVYVRPFPAGGGKWQISDGGGAWPRWTKGGRELVYRTNSGIMAVTVDGSGPSFTVGRPEPVVEGEFRGGLFGIPVAGFIFADFDISPDGTRFVVFPGTEDELSQTHATFMFNWFEDLNKTLPR
jgi:serine/threonine-protein kinase